MKNLSVDGQQLEDVKDFTYIGSVVDTLGGTDQDALTRIGKARAAFLMLKKSLVFKRAIF